MKKNFFIVALLLFSFLQSQAHSDKELRSVLEGYETRVERAFNEVLDIPFKDVPIDEPLKSGRSYYSRKFSFNLMNYAFANFYLKKDYAFANLCIQRNMDYYLSHYRELIDRDNFHWHSDVLLRIIEFYGSKSKNPILTKENEDKIMETLWRYSKRRLEDQTEFTQIAVADQEISNTWFINESENHHVQMFTTLWHFAKLAKDHPKYSSMKYDDGRFAKEHYEKWTSYMKIYFRERAKKGLLIEQMAIGYTTVLLKGIFNVYDFSTDADLKELAGKYLELYFAYWGQEQINGVSGGSKSRVYKDYMPTNSAIGYYFFGLGMPKFEAINITSMTTKFRPSLLVADIALDRKGRGTYEVRQRPMGRAVKGFHTTPVYHMDQDSTGILRYSYCTPSFVIGSSMFEPLPIDKWAWISSQNRSHGITFTGDPTACICPENEHDMVDSKPIPTLNGHWAAQSKGTLIAQKLKYSSQSGHMQVWISQKSISKPDKRGNWFFVESKDAYAGIYIVQGKTEMRPHIEGTIEGLWLYCNKEYTPVILEVDEKKNYSSFNSFKEILLKKDIKYDGKCLVYHSLYGDNFKFFTDYSSAPVINGKKINGYEGKAFDSPYLVSDWNSGIVHIQKGERKEVLDFN